MDVLHARFRRHSFARHSHDRYAIGVLDSGEEGLHWRGSHHVVGPGAVIVISPGDVHTGYSTTPDGWSYRMLYPPVELLSEALGRPAAPRFPRPVLHDPALAAALARAHTALAAPDLVLDAHCRLLHALQHLVSRHGRSSPARHEHPAPTAAVRRALDYLHEHHPEPLTLHDLATVSGLSARHLTRGITTTTGLSPHAYLVQVRVERARTLLARGVRPSRVAPAVGFADQSHLTRHFRRIIGVTPGHYLRGQQPSR